MKRILALTLCILTLFLCACQPTPEVEPVPNKGDDVMGEKIHTTPVPKTPSPTSEADPDLTGEPDVTSVPFEIPHIDVPERWEEEYYIGDIEILFDADVIYEDVAHPVYLMGNLEHFDGAKLNALIAEFVDAEKWMPYEKTRDQLIEQLEALMRGELITDPITGEDSYVMTDEQGERIASVVAQLQDLDPNENWEKLAEDGKLPSGQGYVGDGRRKRYYDENNKTFCIREEADKYVAQEYLVLQEEFEKKSGITELPEPNMTEERAIELANGVLKDLGLDDHLSVAYTVKGMMMKQNIYPNPPDMTDLGWIVSCMTKSNGAKLYSNKHFDLTGGETQSIEVDEYAPYPLYETLELFFSNDNLLSAEWSNPQEIKSVVNPAVELMPFDQIQERIRDRFKYGLAWKNGRDSGYKFRVYEVSLSYVMSQKANDMTGYYWTPVWAVVFERVFDHNMMPFMPLVVYINAIDGTFIRFAE